jgi:hypothetical protein
MQKGQNLTDDHHVLRYVRPGLVDGDGIGTAAFLCKPDENESSVNWMECFDPPVSNQCNCIRDERRIEWKPSGKIARLNVGAAKAYITEEARMTLAFLYDPEDPDPPKYPKPHTSHSIITGMPKLDTPEGEFVGALLRDVIPNRDIFPAMG